MQMVRRQWTRRSTPLKIEGGEMNFNPNRVGQITVALMVIASDVFGGAEEVKRTLKTNYQEVYMVRPSTVESFSEIFSEGKFYGRLRSNTFYFRWNNEDADHDTHLVSGLGGSLIYKSAKFADIDFTAGLYYSQAFFDAADDPVSTLKSGKDVLSRYDYSNTGNKSMSVLGEAYLRYSGIADTQILLGRQLVETFYTKSNDTKMIPNTFDGALVGTKAIPDTAVKLAYLHQQKLRDHTQAHSVLMYGDANSSAHANPEWSENDDTAMHRGLTYTALKTAGKPTDAPLVVGDLRNRSIDNLKIDAAFYAVPELLSQAMGELNYTFRLGRKFSISPGVRYIKQFDNGAGDVGGASYLGSAYTAGYKDPNSLDSQMAAARLVAKMDNYKVSLGYSKVFDEADLITPWRGFPTDGYTRSMARYNWRANTKSYRIELTRNGSSKGIYKDIYMQASVLYTDGDPEKTGAHVLDEIYYYAGFVQNVPSLVALQWRLRLGYAQYLDKELKTGSGVDYSETDFNNLDARFELNYLF